MFFKKTKRFPIQLNRCTKPTKPFSLLYVIELSLPPPTKKQLPTTFHSFSTSLSCPFRHSLSLVIVICGTLLGNFYPDMDPEQPTSPFLAPTPAQLANVKVYPLIPSLKQEVIVRIWSFLKVVPTVTRVYLVSLSRILLVR